MIRTIQSILIGALFVLIPTAVMFTPFFFFGVTGILYSLSVLLAIVFVFLFWMIGESVRSW